jgi:hypothetical protein
MTDAVPFYFASNQIVNDLRGQANDRLRKLTHRRPRKPFWAQPALARILQKSKSGQLGCIQKTLGT